MFAVKGWNITAPLTTQVDSVNPPATPSTPSVAEAADKPSKKRKRGKGPQVTEKNVGELYQLYIDGVRPSKSTHSSTSNTTTTQAEAGASTAAGDSVTLTEGAGRKNKKRKRGTKEKSESIAAAGTEPAEPVEAQTDKATQNDQPAVIGSSKQTSKSGNKRKKDQTLSKQATATEDTEVKRTQSDTVKAKTGVAKPALTPMQSSMAAKLASARFRHLNETLYTKPSAASLTLFTDDPSLFDDYHIGFRQQVEVWPENPVDGYIRDIKGRGKVKGAGDKAKYGDVKALPRSRGICTIADLGCGDANLSKSLQPSLPSLKLVIRSFDLQSNDPLIMKADIAHLPLEDGSVDVAVFCLALMGTNWPDFVAEAWRILRLKGELWIAEIKSRFSRLNTAGKAGTQGGSQGQKVVDHSVGKRRRVGTGLGLGRTKVTDGEDREEAIAAAIVDETMPNGRQTETDVSGFLTVLRRHGFILDGPEDVAVDMKNKMFVKMRFIKVAKGGAGHDREDRKRGQEGDGKKSKGRKELKFLDDEEQDDGVAAAEGYKVLKPCVYKLR